MVFARPERRKLAVLSARSFLAQSWRRKELIIFNATRRRLFLFPRPRVREIRLRQRSLSQMLDICFENANGTWCALWWDDCVYRHDYLETLAREAESASLVHLVHKTIFDKALNALFTTTSNAVMCPIFARCRPVNFSTELEPQFQTVKALPNDPELIVKVVRVLHA